MPQNTPNRRDQTGIKPLQPAEMRRSLQTMASMQRKFPTTMPASGPSHAERCEKFKAELEEKQEVLRKLRASLEDIRSRLKFEPVTAFRQLLEVQDSLAKCPVNYKDFATLEWREYCQKTQGAALQLRAWCETQLSSADRAAAWMDYHNGKLEGAHAVKMDSVAEPPVQKTRRPISHELLRIGGAILQLPFLLLMALIRKVIRLSGMTLAECPHRRMTVSVLASLIMICSLFVYFHLRHNSFIYKEAIADISELALYL